MKKKTFITLIAFISVLCFGLTACAGSSSNKKNGGNDSEYEVTDNYPEDDYGNNEDYDSDYEEADNYSVREMMTHTLPMIMITEQLC